MDFEHENRRIMEVMRVFITLVNWARCTGCEKCVDVCPVGCFEMSEGKSLASGASACIDCGACDEVCPESAIIRSIGWGGIGPVRRSRILDGKI